MTIGQVHDWTVRRACGRDIDQAENVVLHRRDRRRSMTSALLAAKDPRRRAQNAQVVFDAMRDPHSFGDDLQHGSPEPQSSGTSHGVAPISADGIRMHSVFTHTCAHHRVVVALRTPRLPNGPLDIWRRGGRVRPATQDDARVRCALTPACGATPDTNYTRTRRSRRWRPVAAPNCGWQMTPPHAGDTVPRHPGVRSHGVHGVHNHGVRSHACLGLTESLKRIHVYTSQHHKRAHHRATRPKATALRVKTWAQHTLWAQRCRQDYPASYLGKPRRR
jgi:hypothetical protein